MRDYLEWHRDYDNPQSSLAQRLRIVQKRLEQRLAAAPPGRLRLISLCAGQGRDLIPVLKTHARRNDVDAVLVELDAENVSRARQAAHEARLSQVEVVETDAAMSDAYAPYVPADLVLACGIFGNISDADIEGTVRHVSMLCRQGASVIWTRHWNDQAVITNIQRWFTESGFRNLSFDALENASKSGIGVAQLIGPPLTYNPGYRFFTFLR